MRFRSVRSALLLLPLLSAISLSSMAASCPPKTLDPAAKQAFHANTATKHLQELQSTAITANRTGGLSDHDAVLVVRFTTAAAKVVDDSPYGWAASVKTAYTELKANLPPPSRAKLATVFGVLDLFLDTF